MTKRNVKTKSGLQTAKSVTDLDIKHDSSPSDKRAEKTRPRNQ